MRSAQSEPPSRLRRAGDPAADVRRQCEQMRDFVVNLREKIVPEVKNLNAEGSGIQNGSQTLVLWKDRQMAANRRLISGDAGGQPP